MNILQFVAQGDALSHDPYTALALARASCDTLLSEHNLAQFRLEKCQHLLGVLQDAVEQTQVHFHNANAQIGPILYFFQQHRLPFEAPTCNLNSFLVLWQSHISLVLSDSQTDISTNVDSNSDSDSEVNSCEGLMFSLMVFTFCKLLYHICDYMKLLFFISACKGMYLNLTWAVLFWKYPQICCLMVSLFYSFNVNFSNLLQQVVLTIKQPLLLHQTPPFKHHHQHYAQGPLQSMFKLIFILSSSLTCV